MSIKATLHPNNKHRRGYDFTTLIKLRPELSSYIIKNKYNQQDTIDFSNASAVRALNTALLQKDYRIQYWSFPHDYLCPPIPGRVDYIHYLNDLLKETKFSVGGPISVLDIGTGASCVYPILGACEYGWNFVASDIDSISIKTARKIVSSNENIAQRISCRLQKDSSKIFDGIINENDFYHLTMCNPPFHNSLSQATSGTNRKWKNLNKGNSSKNESLLNFGGQKAELWCHGGELGFIRQMIKESRKYQEQVLWFTCLVSKKDHLSKIKLYLKKAHASQIKIIKMEQGNKVSRFIAWRY